jgi:sterol desaturase/sphingolipid hydroxylase (fatty acid hydroxylase superfamily)
LTGAVIQGVSLATFLLVGGLVPRKSDQPILTRDSVRNVLNGGLLFGVRVSLVAWLASFMQMGLIDLSLDGVPAAQFLVGFLVLDFFRYWLHRAHHRVPWLWTFHRVHHSAERLDSTVGLRMHLVDFLQLSLLPVLLFECLFITSGWAPGVLEAVLAVGVVMDAFQHGNIRWNPRHPLARAWNLALNHPLFHSWHHTRDGHRCDGNYGNALVIWDRLFRSEVTGDEPPPLMGLGPDQAIEESLLGWLLLRSQAES